MTIPVWRQLLDARTKIIPISSKQICLNQIREAKQMYDRVYALFESGHTDIEILIAASQRLIDSEKEYFSKYDVQEIIDRDRAYEMFLKELR